MTAGTAATQEPGRTTSRSRCITRLAGSDHGDRHNTTARGNGHGAAIMAPCTLERTETVGNDISISQYSTWQQFGGGFEIVARNGTELERIHARSQRQADETFAMLVGKYGDERHTEQRQERQDAADLYAWASGR